MKNIKNFNEFSNENLNEARYPALKAGTKVTVAKDVKYDRDNEFEEIVLTNGYTLLAAEETGEAYATFAITTDYPVKKGDEISFNFNLGEGENYFMDNSKITINGKTRDFVMYNESGSGEVIIYDK
jgi:hypothetical protein